MTFYRTMFYLAIPFGLALALNAYRRRRITIHTVDAMDDEPWRDVFCDRLSAEALWARRLA